MYVAAVSDIFFLSSRVTIQNCSMHVTLLLLLIMVTCWIIDKQSIETAQLDEWDLGQCLTEVSHAIVFKCSRDRSPIIQYAIALVLVFGLTFYNATMFSTAP